MTGPALSPRRLGLVVPADFLRFVYISIFTLNGVLILATLCWDLGFTLPRGFGQLNLELEGNFAVWYSSALLLIGGGAALLVAFSPPPRMVAAKSYRLVWATVAAFFVALSVDEVDEFHERIGRWFTSEFGTLPVLTDGGYNVFAWIVALLPFIALFVVGMSVVIRSWLAVHRPSRNLATVALCCWIGAFGADVAEAQLLVHWQIRFIEGAIEEGFEITGTALFFVAFCEYLASSSRSLLPDRAREVEGAAL